ncbi:MAG: NUDIX hydrolase [Bacilli bacterium]|nr:NUDIX hydrolase [Bacilli bacterium]
MKTILYNYDNLKEENINRTTRRAKALIINSQDKILFAHSKNNYFFVGGRVEENETFDECIVRETKEETGIDLPLEKREPFFTITYMNKDYPSLGVNTKSITNYYLVKCDTKPDLNEITLTEEEKNNNFKLVYIHKDKALEELNNNLDNCSNKNVVRDTIEVMKEYLKI